MDGRTDDRGVVVEGMGDEGMDVNEKKTFRCQTQDRHRILRPMRAVLCSSPGGRTRSRLVGQPGAGVSNDQGKIRISDDQPVLWLRIRSHSLCVTTRVIVGLEYVSGTPVEGGLDLTLCCVRSLSILAPICNASHLRGVGITRINRTSGVRNQDSYTLYSRLVSAEGVLPV